MLIGSILLAGGRSERMHAPKASLEWGDASLLFDRVEMLLDCSYPVVVVTRDADQELPPINTECETTVDTITDGGPLVGLCSGLQHVANRCDAAIVLGCDFPFFDPRTLHWLADQLGEHAGVVPMNGDTAQPICALYRVSLLPDIERLVASGERAAKAMLDLPGVVTLESDAVDAFDCDRRFLWNINSPADYNQALEWRT